MGVVSTNLIILFRVLVCSAQFLGAFACVVSLQSPTLLSVFDEAELWWGAAASLKCTCIFFSSHFPQELVSGVSVIAKSVDNYQAL